MAKMSIMFDGFNDLAYQIDKVGGDLHKAVDEALTETQKLVQGNLEQAAAPYASGGQKGYATGEMFKAIIRNPEISWTGNVAEVRVGFDLHQEGGYHSLFVMYGVPRHKKNNPGIAKDAKIYNAIRGVRTRKQIEDIQESTMRKYLKVGD